MYKANCRANQQWPDYTEAEVEFLKAVDRYKTMTGRNNPTWPEVLGIVKALGYRVHPELRKLPRRVADDGRERAGLPGEGRPQEQGEGQGGGHPDEPT